MAIRRLRVPLLRLAYVPIVCVALFVWRSWSDESAADFVIEWAGYFFLISGVGLRLWSILYVGSRKSAKLVVEGPYSLCRHPLYMGTIMVVVGASLCFENFVMLVLSLALMIPVHALTAAAEERRLLDLFGQEYEDYRKRTPKYLFSFASYRCSGTVEVSMGAIRKATLETMGVMLIPPVGELIEVLHAAGLLPVLWTPF